MTSPSPAPPQWPHCGHGATAEDPVGCRGRQISPHAPCLAHAPDADRDAYLAALVPGADIDHSGTTFSRRLLNQLLDALRDPGTGHPCLGTADFRAATFEGNAEFESTVFRGSATFESAVFKGNVWFTSAAFDLRADFRSVTFDNHAGFEEATFDSHANFRSATFRGEAWFVSATFRDDVTFGEVTFKSGAVFVSTLFEGHGTFSWATFDLHTRFSSSVFRSDAGFTSAAFTGHATFGAVTFDGDTAFSSAVFASDADFVSATFRGFSRFGAVTFQGGVDFGKAVFASNTDFTSATFVSRVGLAATVFRGDAPFRAVVFEGMVDLGPFVCGEQVDLSEAVFGGPATLRFAARRLECRRTRWSSTAELRLRHATVNFAHAVFEYPLTIAAETDPFPGPGGRPPAEDALGAPPAVPGAPHTPDAAVRLASLRGVDAAHLVLADVDLSGCVFTGTVHLDQLRLEGTCSFAGVPAHRSRRRTLAEEHHWRARRPRPARGWTAAEPGSPGVGPAQLAPVYRALRKAYEDGKNEPGAADFYYGEMEMRRHDRSGTGRAERGLLHGYWLLSGYGLRASRALGWLAAAMLGTVLLLMGTGLPQDAPKQEAVGTVPPGGGTVTFEIDKADPLNPTGDRFTAERFEKALNVTLNSVVFRSSGQDLTTAGTYTEMASRVAEPVLLGLAVLAVRNRVRR